MALTGKQPTTIVVDDPHGYVVPSHGVEIVGRALIGKALEFARSSVFDRMVPEPGVTIKREPPPVIKGSKGRATKQRLKGLRP